MSKISSRSVIDTAKEIAITFFGLFILYGFALFIIGEAYNRHLALGVLATVAYGGAVYIGVKDFWSPEARQYSVYKGSRIFGLLVLLGAAVFGSLSLLLAKLGWATYATERVALASFNEYYIWVFLDLLPGLKVTQTLGVSPPVKPEGAVAGLPVVAFRAFVVYGLLKALRYWWANRKDPAKGELGFGPG